jgi:hypothetical protein
MTSWALLAYSVLCYVFCRHQMTFSFELGEDYLIDVYQTFLMKEVENIKFVYNLVDMDYMLTGERVPCLARSRCRVLVILPSYHISSDHMIHDMKATLNPKP